MGDIVVGVDGSSHSAVALRWALDEADARGGTRVVAVLVWDLFNQRHADGSRRFDPEYDEASAEAALAHFVDEAVGAERACEIVLRPVCDAPAPGLLTAAAEAELLVVGARGLGGFRGLLLGSVSQQCLHHAAGAIAVVHGGPADGPHAIRRVVVGVDGSEASAAALAWAVGAATARNSVLEVVHAWELPVIYGPVVASYPFDIEAIESEACQLVDKMVADATAAASDLSVERRVVEGGPASTLLEAAEDAELVVVGRRGLGGFGRLLLGSVSDHVARHAASTVVVVPADPTSDAA
jgi:nucleotide-binding universal stress UspA family protein